MSKVRSEFEPVGSFVVISGVIPSVSRKKSESSSGGFGPGAFWDAFSVNEMVEPNVNPITYSLKPVSSMRTTDPGLMNTGPVPVPNTSPVVDCVDASPRAPSLEKPRMEAAFTGPPPLRKSNTSSPT